MCTVLLPPGVNPIAVNKYIISYITRIIPLFLVKFPHEKKYDSRGKVSELENFLDPRNVLICSGKAMLGIFVGLTMN